MLNNVRVSFFFLTVYIKQMLYVYHYFMCNTKMIPTYFQYQNRGRLLDGEEEKNRQKFPRS